jgi:hypothetical protein
MPAVSPPPTRRAYSSPRPHVRSALSRPPLPAPPRPARRPGTRQSAPSASTFRKPHSSISAGASPPPGGPTAKKPVQVITLAEPGCAARTTCAHTPVAAELATPQSAN